MSHWLFFIKFNIYCKLEYIKKYTYNILYKKLFGKNVRFISDCQFFPNFDVTIKINKIYYGANNEILFEGKTSKNKKLTIGSNMKNLQFEII